jgi:hypothetical protein
LKEEGGDLESKTDISKAAGLPSRGDDT